MPIFDKNLINDNLKIFINDNLRPNASFKHMVYIKLLGNHPTVIWVVQTKCLLNT